MCQCCVSQWDRSRWCVHRSTGPGGVYRMHTPVDKNSPYVHHTGESMIYEKNKTLKNI